MEKRTKRKRPASAKAINIQCFCTYRALIDDSYSKSLLVEDVTDRELDRIGRIEACQIGVCL